MKKMLAGLMLVSSISAMATCEVKLLEIGNEGVISNSTLSAIEAKGYSIDLDVIGTTAPVAGNVGIDEGYEIVISASDAEYSSDKKVKQLFESFSKTRNRMVTVRKIKRVRRDDGLYNWFKSEDVTAVISKKRAFSKVTDNQKLIEWGLSVLPTCDEVKGLKADEQI